MPTSRSFFVPQPWSSAFNAHQPLLLPPSSTHKARAMSKPAPRNSADDTLRYCDHSNTAPAVNVGDFTCFISRFSAGCP